MTSSMPTELAKDELMLEPSDIASGIFPPQNLVKLGKVFTIETTLLVKTIGRLSPKGIQSVIDGVRTVIST